MNTIESTKVTKTKEGWDKNGKNLLKYLQVGDFVDDEMKMYFLETLPPRTWTNKTIQMGEPYSHDENGHGTYSTLENSLGGWIYTGEKTVPRFW